MTFDPPPTAEQVSRKSYLTSHHSLSFPSSRRAPSQEPPAYTTEDVLAAKYQKLAKLLSSLRIATTAITLAISISVIGCAANSLQTYSGNDFSQDWGLPLWPLKVDLRPTRAVLSSGVIVTVASLVYLGAAFFPSVSCSESISLSKLTQPLQPRPKLHLLNITSSILSSVCLFTTLFTAIFASTINSHLADDTISGSLQSWTCRWSGFENVAPAEFGKICTESMVSLSLVILLVVFEVVAVVGTAAGWWIESRMRKESENNELKVVGGSA